MTQAQFDDLVIRLHDKGRLGPWETMSLRQLARQNSLDPLILFFFSLHFT
jgi:hypothetical protein